MLKIRAEDAGTLTTVRFTNLSRTFAGYTAVAGINLEVRAGKFLSVVGPSGCGKSTLLNMAAGLMEPSEGTVEISGQPLAGINRQAAYLFQQDALLPWKTVLGNILFGLDFRGTVPQQAEASARAWIKGVGLDGLLTPDGRMPAGAAEAMYRMLAGSLESVKNAKIDLAATWTDEYLEKR